MMDRVGGPEAGEVQPLVALQLTRSFDLRATLAGFAAPAIFSLLIGALLWGTGEQVRTVEDAFRRGGPSGSREGVAWLAAVLLVLLLSYALLPLARPFVASASGVWRAHWRANERIYRGYGLDPEVVWPRLKAVLPVPTLAALARREARVASMESAAAGWVLTGLFMQGLLGITAAPLGLRLIVAIVTIIMMANTIFRLSGAAREFELAREVAVDLHRFDLLRALHVALPSTPEEEREVNRQLTEELAGRPKHLRYEHPTDELAPLSSAQLRASLSEALEDIVAEPPLVNFSGWVSVAVEDSSGLRLPLRGETVSIRPGRPYRLRVAFSGNRRAEAPAARIDVQDGLTASEVPFRIEIDTTTVQFARLQHDVAISTSVPDSAFAIDFEAPEQTGTHAIWVQVLQSTRLLQVVLVKVEVESHETAGHSNQ